MDQGLYCVTCGKQTLHKEAEQVNHTLHAILSIFTCCLWGIPWIILSIAVAYKEPVCAVCGTEYDQARATQALRRR